MARKKLKNLAIDSSLHPDLHRLSGRLVWLTREDTAGTRLLKHNGGSRHQFPYSLPAVSISVSEHRPTIQMIRTPDVSLPTLLDLTHLLICSGCGCGMGRGAEGGIRRAGI
jgi:hypothetical protein